MLWAAGDSSAGSLLDHNNKKSDASHGIRKFYPLLLLASTAMVYPLVRAEERGDGFLAQASLLTILLLLAFTVWCWWQENNKPPELSIKAAIYHRALEKLLWCVAIGIFAMIIIATRQEHWGDFIVAKAIGYGILIAGAAFI